MCRGLICVRTCFRNRAIGTPVQSDCSWRSRALPDSEEAKAEDGEKRETLRFLASETEGWQDADGDFSPQFQAGFARIMTSRYLAVLSGLGTSRYIEDSGGKKVAATMADLWDAVKKANDS